MAERRGEMEESRVREEERGKSRGRMSEATVGVPESLGLFVVDNRCPKVWDCLLFRPLNVFRCSGCTHQFNLHRPVIVDEATEFFNTVGVSDFTLTVANCGYGGVAQS